MQIAKNQFSSNIKYVRELDSLYHFLKDNLNLTNDLSDLLRAEIVYSVSALDKLIHELVRMGMIESFNGLRPQTRRFKAYTLTADTLNRIMITSIERAKNPAQPPLPIDLPEYWFEQEIILKHKFISYQDTDKISEGLSLIWVEDHKWQKISMLMSIPEDDVKKKLTNIVSDRNRIVHEADINVQTGQRNSIDESDAAFTINFIELLGYAIFDCVK